MHREYIESIPVVGRTVADKLNERADVVSSTPETRQPLTVAIRTINEADLLEGFFEDFDRQEHANDVEVIVVDNESTDRTPEVARYFGATVISLARDEFTYPRSMNMAMIAASHDAVFLTVGHARLSNDQTFKFNLGQMASEGGNVAGAYTPHLPNANASLAEKLVSIGNRLFVEPKKIKKAGMGVLGATNALIDKQVWKELGRFDERYETGGEDTALAKAMIEAGYDIVTDPILAVHHSHGLGPINYLRQAKRWQRSLKGPEKFDRPALIKSRPDLKLED